MSLVQELHDARKARLARIEGAGLRSAEQTVPAVKPAIVPNVSDEIAWTIAVEGYRPDTIQPTIKQIRNAVCAHFNVSVNDLCGRRRPLHIVVPRHVAYYLCGTLTLKSWPEIGRRLGGRDHTTCLHGFKKIKKQVLEDAWLLEAVETITNKLAAKDVFRQRKPRTVLNPVTVREIRESKAQQSVLAMRYGVDIQTIKHVRQRRTWRNVA